MTDTSDVINENALLVSTFYIDDARFGIDSICVQEVVNVKGLTRVHHAPPYVQGVMNLRGRIVTVIDLGEKLSMSALEITNESRIFIVDWKQEHVGLLVERVAEIAEISKDEIKQPPDNVNGVQASMLNGVFKTASGHLVGLLNIDAILAIDEKISK